MNSNFSPDLILDFPKDGIIQTPMEQLWGWIKVASSEGRMCVQIQGVDIPFAQITRSNLDPNRHIGFSIFIDLVRLKSKLLIQPGALTVNILLDGDVISEIPLSVTQNAVKDIDILIGNLSRKQNFVQENTTSELRYIDGCHAPSALPDDWTVSPSMSSKRDAVSSHAYGKVVRDFLSQVPDGGFTLDAGAGFRKSPYVNVVNMEIYDYPSTDILAIGQKLPFKSNCFDAVLSLAVLEHVDDPFLCAQELIRVLKPGGRAMVIVPFLQAEHGYPSHFFNCTRFGLKKLFEQAEVVDHFLEVSNLPINTVHQILRLYAAGLPNDLRDQFLNMKISDILSGSPIQWIMEKHPLITELNSETNWIIASGTTAIFEKPI